MIKVYYWDEITENETSILGSYMDYSVDGKHAFVHDTTENEQNGSEVIILDSERIIRVEAI